MACLAIVALAATTSAAVRVHAASPEASPPSPIAEPRPAMPAAPLGSAVQAPFAMAPRAAEQTSHGPLHVLSQQKPSTHMPPAQSLSMRQARPVENLQTPLPSH